MTVETEILAAEKARYDAMVAADLEALEGLCATGLVYVHSSGKKDDRQTYLSGVADGVISYEAIDHAEECVNALGDTMLVWGTMHASGIAYGKVVQISSRVLAVWVRKDNRWQIIGVQSTRLPA